MSDTEDDARLPKLLKEYRERQSDEAMQEKRCTGHCCKRFCLPMSADKLISRQGQYTDGPQIADMVIPLGLSNVDNRGVVGDTYSHYFTCKHLSPRGDCTIYDKRPKMCRGYPYSGACGIPECTSAKRAKPGTPEDDLSF